MKNPILRKRALERLYQKALRLERDDQDKLITMDPELAVEFDEEKRAKEFVASMSDSTLVLLGLHVREQHGLDALEEFSWLMPSLHGTVFALQSALDRQSPMTMVD